MTRTIAAAFIAFAASLCALGQNPVQWTLESETAKIAPGGHLTARLTARLEPGWHLYSPTTPPGGPIPTALKLADNAAVEKASIYQPKPERKFDPNFNIEVEWFEKEVVFLADTAIKKDAAAGPLELTAQVRYQACNDRLCLPPKKKSASLTVTVDPGAQAPVFALPAGYGSIERTAAVPAAPTPSGKTDANFLLVAFGFGLAAIFTPCVFPMIPITVSFFLSRQGGSRLTQALVFCLGIVVLFCAFGFAVTAIAGPFGVVQLGSNPWVNGFIAVVFIVLALSLLGAFEITLPSGLLTKLDSASRSGGYGGTLLMGLTFSLTSFACIGPFVGTLLAASVQTGGMQPLLGMASFATGLATPFFFLALFPSYLNKLPRSGGWMARVKIVLGFVILAAALKYVSNVDAVLQTGRLSREVYIAAWFVLFALPGLYLLGFLRMEGIKPEERVGAGRVLIGAAFLTFAISLLPGMFGAPLGPVEPYVPPAQGDGVFAARGPQQIWLKDKYDEALARARQENKYVLVTFTGYACTNCHWMKANMFPRPEIAAAVKDMILVELYTDGSDDVSRRNQELEQKTFSTVAIPYYALMDGDAKVIASFGGSTSNAREFLAFLSKRPQQQS